jgi:hypothetical protein
VDPEFVGTWEGTVDFGVPTRIVLTISNGKDGSEAHTVDGGEGNAQISFTQKGTKLILEIKPTLPIEGSINEEGTEISGTLTQLGMSAPLVWKKAAQAK